jgi:hypothetical protein
VTILREGDRIHYSGDVANRPGWFRVMLTTTGPRLVEESDLVWGGESRSFILSPREIGDVYAGHCNPRFVTEAAYKAYHASREAK